MIDLDALARAAADLDPLPASVTGLAVLVCDGTPEIADVVELVQFDQALTATLLRTANSSWSASRVEITTVKDAVVRLGSGPVLSLALAVDIRGRLQHAIPEYGLAEGDLWEHSVAAAVAAELVARHAAVPPPAETATAALLHDVGKLVMARFLEPALLVALQRAEAQGLTRRKAEADVLGIDHAELGALIAQSWGLPPALVRGIGSHHEPTASDVVACGVHVADVLAKTVGAGLDDNPDAATFTTACATLGLAPDGFEAVCRLVEARLEAVRGRFA
ncbi:MAG: HDOD domain-containing protein [Actinomycetota bacterium]